RRVRRGRPPPGAPPGATLRPPPGGGHAPSDRDRSRDALLARAALPARPAADAAHGRTLPPRARPGHRPAVRPCAPAGEARSHRAPKVFLISASRFAAFALTSHTVDPYTRPSRLLAPHVHAA